MLTKEKIISGIQKLPETVKIDDVLDHIILLEKIEKGLEQSSKGQVITDEDLDNNEICKVAEKSESFKFLHNKSEDIYTDDDLKVKYK